MMIVILLKTCASVLLLVLFTMPVFVSAAESWIMEVHD